LEEVQPPKSLVDAKVAFEKAEEELKRKQADLKSAQEFCTKEKKGWMTKQE